MSVRPTRSRTLSVQPLESRSLLAAHISELLVAPLFGSNDTTQMVELRGEPNATLASGSYLVVVNERGTDTGKIHGIFNLSGQSFGSNGYLAILQKDSPHQPVSGTNVLRSTETGFGGLPGDLYSDSHSVSDRIDFIIGANTYVLLQSSVAPVLGLNIDANADGLIDSSIRSQWNIMDSISLHPFVGRGNVAFGDVVFAETGTGATEIKARSGVSVVFTEGFGYAGRVGESTGTSPDDWIASTVINELRSETTKPPRWALVDNLFGVPSQYEFSGRDLDHVGGPNFVGGARGKISSSLPEVSVSGLTVFADTNSNGARDLLTHVVDPDQVIIAAQPNATYPLINAFPGVTITNFSLDSFPASQVTAEKQFNFPNTLNNRIFAKGGIDWFSTSNVLRFDFYHPVRSISIDAIGDDSSLSKVFGRIDAFNAAGELVGTDRSGLLPANGRETISVSAATDVITYAFAYADDNFLDGGPFGRFDRMSYTQLEPSDVTDAAGNYEIQRLFPDEYKITVLGNTSNVPAVPVEVKKHENFVVNFGFVPNQPPVIETASFEIAENVTGGSTVGAIVASDPESKPLTYRFTDGTVPGFSINESTGEIKVAQNTSFDFESQSLISFGVTVTDTENASASTTVTIAVRDVNEPPQVENALFTVSESAQVGSEIGSVVATDADTEQTLSYEIVGGSGSSIFAIDRATGLITVKNTSSLNFESTRSLNIDVRIRDSGTPSLSVTKLFTIGVADVNELPVIETTQLFVNENRAGDVGRVLVNDPDLGQQHSFEIVGGSAMDRVTISDEGVLSVLPDAAFDFEAGDTFTVEVRVTDSGTSPLTAVKNITIQVRNVDEAPVFDGDVETMEVMTGEELNFQLPEDLVSDPDGDDWTLAASLDNRALPSWLTFNAATREFTGIPTGIFAGPTIITLRTFHPNTPQLASVMTFRLNVTLSEKPMHNSVTPQDVSGDKNVTAGDALLIINYLNVEDSLGSLSDDFRFASFFDVTGDNNVSPADALDVLFQIRQDDLETLDGRGSGESTYSDSLALQPKFDETKRKAHDEAIEAYVAERSLF